MPEIKCPVEGFEDVSITMPDVLLVRHNEAFWQAYRAAGEVSHNTALLHGSIAVCSEIKGLPADMPVGDYPLALFRWLIDTIYRDGIEKALNPSKN